MRACGRIGDTLRSPGVDGKRAFLVDESDRWARCVNAAKIEPQ